MNDGTRGNMHRYHLLYPWPGLIRAGPWTGWGTSWSAHARGAWAVDAIWHIDAVWLAQ